MVSLQTGAESDVTALFIDSSDHVVKKGLGTLAFENSLTFASLTSKPTTIAGYGITDSLQIGTTSTTALAGNTTVGTVVTGNGGGTGDTLSSISIGGTNFTVATGTGDGSVTSVGTTGTVNGITLTGTVTSAGSLTLGGTLAISNADWSGTDLSVSNGGTGLSSLTSTYIPYLSLIHISEPTRPY